MEIVGTVTEEPRLFRNRRGRFVLSFAVTDSATGRRVAVTVRDSKAERWAEVLAVGSEVRLEGEPRVARYFKAKRLRPAVERWRAIPLHRATG
jgi:hypothetical protein